MAQRVVRVKEKDIEQPKESKTPEEAKRARKMIELAGKISEKQAEIAAKTETLRMDATELATQYAEQKVELLALMKRKKITEFQVDGFDVFAKSKTETDVQPEKLYKYFAGIRDTKKFFEFVKVKMTDAKKFIGEAVLKDFWDQDTKNYTDIDIRAAKVAKTRVKKTR